jgi:putative hemolysin
MDTHGLAAPIERGDWVPQLLGNLVECARDRGSRHARNGRVIGLVPQDRRTAASRYRAKVFTGQAVPVSKGFESLSRRSLWGHDQEL